jgi:hypothetical protein
VTWTEPSRPDRDPEAGGGTQEQWFNTIQIGDSGSAFARPAPGTFGNLGRNQLRGPGYWRTDASLFKRFSFTENAAVEFRMEVLNLFNTVNLGQPDTEVGLGASAGNNLNPNAGRITQNAYGGTDPQRNMSSLCACCSSVH